MSAVQGEAGEPRGEAAESGDGHSHEHACLNCGAALVGDYCHACGQKAHVHRTLGAFWHDLLHGVLHVEGKVWRTLPMLAWRPGDLTRRYAEGERAKFLSPMAMFLFSVFLMFAVFNLIGGSGSGSGRTTSSEDMMGQIESRRSELQQEIRTVEQQRDLMRLDGRPTPSYDARLARLLAHKSRLDETEKMERERPGSASPSDLDPAEFRSGRVNTGSPWLDKKLEKAIRNPALAFYKLQTNAYKFSWALIPISIPFVALLFIADRKRRWRMYDHTVFVTYSLTFMTLAMILFYLARAAGVPEEPCLIVLAIVAPVHMFRQLKGAYGLRAWGALWRTVLLIIFSLVSLALFLALLVAMGLFG